jgi:lipoprotein-releasing system ATP-binding protein
VDVPVLKGVDLSVAQGETVAILGSSGSGKSTLLHVVGGIDRPDAPRSGAPSPSIVFDGRQVVGAGSSALDAYRRRDVGFVFQFYHLLPELTVLENVLLAAMIKHGAGFAAGRAHATERAKALLDQAGLSHRLRHRPVELSGGERQRVAISRALINEPRLLLADEPTGNLDARTGGAILDLLEDLRERQSLTMLLVTHDLAIAKRANRVISLKDGQIEASDI